MEQSDNSALPGRLVLNHQELKNIASTGAKHVLEGASQFFVRSQYDLEASYQANLDWSQRMLQDVGDRVRYIAERTDQTPDAVLRNIYSYAVPIAKLIQDGERIAAASWIHRYAETVAKRLGMKKEDPYDPPTPGSVDGVLELFKHPAAHQDDNALAVSGLCLFVVACLFFVFTDPAAFLNNGLAFASLIVTGVATLLGGGIGYIWVRKKIRKVLTHKPQIVKTELFVYLSRCHVELLVRSGHMTGLNLPNLMASPEGEYRIDLERDSAIGLCQWFKDRYIGIWRELGAKGTPFDTINLDSPESTRQLERINCWTAVKMIETALGENLTTGFGSDKLGLNVVKEGHVYLSAPVIPAHYWKQ